MASSAEIAMSLLDFAEPDFFDLDRSVLSQREMRLLDTDFFGVAVNAPRQVMIRQHEKLPLIMATRASGERGWHVRLRDNCILVGTNMNDGSVHVANGLISEKELGSRGGRERPRQGPAPAGLAALGTSVTELDARRQLDINWTTGRWALAVLYYDWPSNVVLVDLRGEGPAPRSRAHPVNPSHNPGHVPSAGLFKSEVEALPSYLPSAKTPPLPARGASFVVECHRDRSRLSAKVFGSFVVPVREFHRLDQKVLHEFDDGARREVAAIVPVTLALVALDWGVPRCFDWAVPVYGEPGHLGPSVQGYFAVDVLAPGNDAATIDPGRYLCYVIIDDRVVGPQSLEVPPH